MKRVLLIIPAYNEEENIKNTIDSINTYRKSKKPSSFKLDYIVIDDGSEDQTYEVCRKNHIHVIKLSSNLGIGGAVQTGYKYAKIKDYDIAVQFDGDGQHDINSIDDLLEPILEGRANMTVGSRFVGDKSEFKSSFLRRIGIRILSSLVRIFSAIKIYDITSGYRACDKNIIKCFARDYPIDYPEPESLVQVSKDNYKIEEVGVRMFAREKGESSINLLDSAYYMIKVSIAIAIRGLQEEGEKD